MPNIITRGAASLKSLGFSGGRRNIAVTYLVVAGGGGGGSQNNSGGGGGAGGLLTNTAVINLCTAYTVTVGGGGNGGSSTAGSKGSNSVFSTVTACGGGGGAYYQETATPLAGGSGGGANAQSNSATGGLGVVGQGHNGGNAPSVQFSGGGGGAGTVGGCGVCNVAGGAGGTGLALQITGSCVYYSGGGGGGVGGGGNAPGHYGGAGGAGGGGKGSDYSSSYPSGGTANVVGTTNTGGGGGGGGASFPALAGANGGSGIVIVRYPGSVQYYTGGTVWASYDGYVVHSFISSGTLTPTTPTQLNPYPVAIGASYGGGYFAGRITIGGTLYNLVVSPKASGYDSGISKPYKTANTSDTGANSYYDGMANSNALNDSNHPAVQFCRSLTIGGYSDWYLPSVNELEVIYNYLKPGTTLNNTTGGLGGANPNAVAPELINTAYTTSRPLQTTAGSLWKSGGSESFEELIYITSTSDNGSSYARNQYFDNGEQWYDQKIGTNNKIRAIRKVAA